MGPALRFAVAALAGVVLATPVAAAEIKVIGSPGFRQAYTELLPGFEKATGHRVTTIWGGVNEVAKRVGDGEAADVVILPLAQIEDLSRQGKLATRADVASSGVGVAVRAGAVKPDIGTPESLKAALLKAKTISYSTGPSGVHMARLIKEWGIEDALKAKIVVSPANTPVGEIVARGEAEIGFQQVSELIRSKGVSYLGPLPPSVQETTVFTAAVHAKATSPEAAKALIAYLSAPAAAAIIRKTGMEPGRR